MVPATWGTVFRAGGLASIISPQIIPALTSSRGTSSWCFFWCLSKSSVHMQIRAVRPGSLLVACPDAAVAKHWLQHGQLLLAHLALPLSVCCLSHVHQQQFGPVSAHSGSQGLSVVPPHLQHPGQVAALGWEKWHSQMSGFLPG